MLFRIIACFVSFQLHFRMRNWLNVVKIIDCLIVLGF